MNIKKLQLAPPYARDTDGKTNPNMKIEFEAEFADHLAALDFFIQLNRLVMANQKKETD